MLRKSEWRTILKQRRKTISFERQTRAQQDAYHFLNSLCHDQSHILSYASFGTELNTWLLNEKLMKKGQLVLPRLEGSTLTLFRVTSKNQLEEHSWGILQPNPLLCQSIFPEQIGLALIPGLGFDHATKGRLGYGKGHYDRLLTSLKRALRCGIGFLEQSISACPLEPHDRLMHNIYLF